MEKVGRLSVLFMAAIRIGLLISSSRHYKYLQYRGNYDIESFINASCNDGKDWIILENERNNCIHHIAFDPTNPNIMIYSGEYFLKKTIDKGRIWNPVLKDDVYFYKTIYDKEIHKYYILLESPVFLKKNINLQFIILLMVVIHGLYFIKPFIGCRWNYWYWTYDDILILYTYTDGIYIYRIKWIILLLVTFMQNFLEENLQYLPVQSTIS